MEMGFRLFDQEEGQLGVLGVLKLQDDGGDEEQVGVAQARLGQVGWVDAFFGHLEAQAPGQPPEVVVLQSQARRSGS